MSASERRTSMNFFSKAKSWMISLNHGRNCLLVPLLSAFALCTGFSNAGTLGVLTYEISGESATITQVDYLAQGEVVIPSLLEGKPVTTIADNACYSRNFITSVTLPPSITRIGKEAFFVCRRLKSLNIPAAVTEIGDSAFSSCAKLEQIHLPPGLKTISEGLFVGCSSLRECVIPDQVTEIKASAFGSSGLERVTVPSNVKTFGARVFQNCVKLRQVKLPNGMKDLSNRTFSGCSALERISLPDGLKRIGDAAFSGTSLSDLHLDGVQVIGVEAFSGCNQLATVRIPKSVTDMGDLAFSNCVRLAGARFDGNAPKMGDRVFGRSAGSDTTDFTIFVEGESTGFSVPRWLGYRLSRPGGEIAIDGFKRPYLQINVPFTFKFGQLPVGDKTIPQVFKLTNVGNRPLTSIRARMKGGDTSDFLIVVPARTSLAAGKSTTVEIAFSPKKRGKRQATLELESSDSNESRYEIQLTGFGIEFF